MKKCIACGNELFPSPLLKFDNMPSSAQNFSNLESEKGIKLNLCQCSGCGLVQFDCEPVSYYKDVIRSGGYSTTMRELRLSQYTHFIDYFNLTGKKIIEVGAGQGEFLSVLSEFSVNSFGIENNEELVNIAKDKGLNVSICFAENEATIIPNMPFDAFVSFNFLEHQPHPQDMLRCIYKNLTDDGVGLITVPSLEYILDNDGYYEFIRDHIAYYTFGTLKLLLENNGFQVVEQEMVNRDTLSVLVKKRSCIDVSQIKLSVFSLINELNQCIDLYIGKGKKVAIWGASHQGFTIASTTHISNKIEYIIDSAPFKHGKYAPASHLLIVPPDYFFKNPVDAIIIIAPGYVNEIKNLIKKQYGKNVDVYTVMSKRLEKIDLEM